MIYMKRAFLPLLVITLMGQGCMSATPSTQPAPIPKPLPTETPTPEPIPVPDPTPSPQPSTQSVTIQNFAFAPSTIRVKKGDRVVFTNRDSIGHTVTADGGAFDSSLILQNGTYTLDTSDLEPGSYPYHCTPHPNMRGTIVVE